MLVRVVFRLWCWALCLHAAVYAEDWDCGTTQVSGVFDLPASCTNMKKEVEVSNSLTISGTQGSTQEVWAESEKRHFKVGSTLTLKWFTLRGGNPKDGSGGGSIQVNSGGVVILHDMVIKDNKHEGTGKGGAFLVDGGTITLTRVTVEGNIANEGGGFYLQGSSVLTMRECWLKTNKFSDAGNLGRQLFIDGSDVQVKLVNTKITNDPDDEKNFENLPMPTCSDNDVCSVAPFNGTCTANTHTVKCDCHATSIVGEGTIAECPEAGTWDCRSGAGTFIRENECTLGGQVDVTGNLNITGRSSLTKIIIDKCVVTNIDKIDCDKLSQSECEASGCCWKALSHGSSTPWCYKAASRRHFRVSNQTLTLKWLLLVGGSVDSAAGAFGGSVYVQDKGVFVATFCRFERNSAVYGGSIAGVAGAIVRLTNTNITTSSASRMGGGIWLASDSLENFFGSTFLNWTSRPNLEATEMTTKQVNGMDCMNPSSLSADVVEDIKKESISTFWYSTFSYEICFKAGGTDRGRGKLVDTGYMLKQVDNDTRVPISRLYMRESRVEQNTATQFGGGMQIQDAEAFVYNSVFENNTAGQSGGGVYLNDETLYPTYLNMTGCTLRGNKMTNADLRAEYGGGALYTRSDSRISLRQCSFTDNVADNGQGHQIMTWRTPKPPSQIVLVNINGLENVSANFFGASSEPAQDEYVGTKTCAFNPCTVTPYTTKCQDNPSTPNHGVVCLPQCSIGTYGPGGACTPCIAGKYGVKGGVNIPETEACTKCSANSFQPIPGQDACDACPTGRYTQNRQPLSPTHFDNADDCVLPPTIVSIRPNVVRTVGLDTVSFVGTHFGNVSSNIHITVNGASFTDIVRHNSSYITAVAPAGVGKLHRVEMRVDDISNIEWKPATLPPKIGTYIRYRGTTIEGDCISIIGGSYRVDGQKTGKKLTNIDVLLRENYTVFSYLPPNISRVDSPPFKGGTVLIKGTNFGSWTDQIVIHVVRSGCGAQQESCEYPEPGENGDILCQYTSEGQKGTCNKVTMTVAGQSSNDAEFCYDVDKGEITGVPPGTQRVLENDTFAYEIGITAGIIPVSHVQVTLLAQSNTPSLECAVYPDVLVLSSSNATRKEPILVTTSGNVIDEGTGATAFVCEVLHSISSTDPQYATSPPRRLTVQVMNDDHADAKLWTINQGDDSYGYDVKFVSFFVTEGGRAEYGVSLDTEPQSPVTVRPRISLIGAENIPAPPVLMVRPASLTFTANNWSSIHRFQLISMPNEVDHDVEQFRIDHEVITDDHVMKQKATARGMLAIVDVDDDDTAAIVMKSNEVLSLTENGQKVGITIDGLATQPTSNVDLIVDIPSDIAGFISVSPSVHVSIQKERWKDINVVFHLQALEGVQSGPVSIKLRPRSDDANYNSSAIALTINCMVILATSNPTTNITLFPPPISAWQRASFQFFSPDKKLLKFQWRLDAGGYKDLECSHSSSCTLDLPSDAFGKLSYGQHRLDVRAVSTNGQTDESPSFVDWTISHCNDRTNRQTDTYAKIAGDGALQCVDCPHPVGANCRMTDIEWDGVYANPGWWTSGTKDDTYYKCPFKTACIGGHYSPRIDLNGTVVKNGTKSACETGFTGVLCAVCTTGYYLLDDQCWRCLPSDGGAETLVTLTMTAAVGIFLIALLVQLRVRDSHYYWKEVKELAHGIHHRHEHGDQVERKTVKNSKRLQEEEEEAEAVAGTVVDSVTYIRQQEVGRTLKTFIGFVQVLSVSDSAFKIPWPSGFLSFLKILVPFNFDFLSVSGIGCLVEYNFFHSYMGMALLPLGVLSLVLVTYNINLARQKMIYRDHFTLAMRHTYTNHAIQFTMWSVLLMYPPLSRRMVEYFACSAEIDGKYFLVKDFRIECFGVQWSEALVVAIIALLLYPLGIPAYFTYQLYSHRHKLRSDRVLARFGFLYEAYRPGAYLWDIFEMLRKLFLTGVIVILYPGEIIQIIIVVLVNLLFLVIILVERPHLPGPGRTLAAVTYTGICLTMLLGLILTSVESAKDYSLFLDIVLVGVNGGIVAYTVFVIVSPTLSSSGRCCFKKPQKSPVKVAPHHYSEMEATSVLFGGRHGHKSKLKAAEKAWEIDDGSSSSKR